MGPMWTSRVFAMRWTIQTNLVLCKDIDPHQGDMGFMQSFSKECAILRLSQSTTWTYHFERNVLHQDSQEMPVAQQVWVSTRHAAHLEGKCSLYPSEARP
mmetsp:Transcript_28625/g.68906  ORF Transcript_28625/g.68906 Transcript_28625/m.68906 type:complete len:100 (-) Transcript_28625:249-548(-)